MFINKSKSFQLKWNSILWKLIKKSQGMCPWLFLIDNFVWCKHYTDSGKLAWPSNLEELYLGGNYFRNDIVSSFAELRHLKVIDLGGNLLEGSLDISGQCYLYQFYVVLLNNPSPVFYVWGNYNSVLHMMNTLCHRPKCIEQIGDTLFRF